MRPLLWSVALVAVFAGCSRAPKPVAEAVAAPDTTVIADSAAVEDTTRTNPPEPKKAAQKPKRTATVVTPKPPAPAPVTTPNDGVVAGSSTSAPVDTVSTRKEVVPQLTADERRELEKTSREQIDAARTLLSSLDAAKLDAEKQRKLLIAQGFLADAIAARAQEDWMRASQLATKAKVLADELTAN